MDEIWRINSVGRRRNGEAGGISEVVDIELDDINLFGTAGGSGSEIGVGYVEGHETEPPEEIVSTEFGGSSFSASGGCFERGIALSDDGDSIMWDV